MACIAAGQVESGDAGLQSIFLCDISMNPKKDPTARERAMVMQMPCTMVDLMIMVNITRYMRLSLSEFMTTLMLENAMAAPANIGFKSMPKDG